MSMRAKLSLLLALPMAAFLAFAGRTAWQTSRRAAEMSDLSTLVDVAVSGASYVHASQVERGMTAVFLSSKGARFADELARQRRETDLRVVAFSDRVRALQHVGVDDVVRTLLDATMRDIEALATVRDRVDAQSLDVGAAVKYYTGIHAKLLELVGIVSTASSDGRIANEATAYTTFLTAKEKAGIERAIVASALTSGGFTVERYESALRLVEDQQVMLDLFRTLSDESTRKAFAEEMNDASVREAAAVREAAFTAHRDRANAPQVDAFGIPTPAPELASPERWFELQTAKIDKMAVVEASLGSNLLDHARRESSSAGRERRIALGAMLVTTLALTALAVSVTRSILSALVTSVDVTRSIADGDLTRAVRVDGTDEFSELQKALHGMQENLRDIVVQIRLETSEVLASATDIATSSSDLNARAVEQAAAIEESAATMEEMSSSTEMAAASAAQAQALADGAAGSAGSGREVVNEAMTVMQKIAAQSSKVTEITEVINDIAFQTNLLAINAAVEAARAGEQGRGFAVVASEVRALAQRTTGSAKEIREIIEESSATVEQGMTWVGRSRDTLEKIAEQVASVSSTIAEIAATSKEHSAGIANVNEAISAIDGAAQQTAAMVEEASRTSERLRAKAARTKELLSTFVVPDTTGVANATRGRPVETHARPTATTGRVAEANEDEDDEWNDLPEDPAVRVSGVETPPRESAA